MTRLGTRQRGDLIIKVRVEVPKNLTPKQKELLKEFEASLGEKNHKEKKSFIDKIKSHFA